MTYPLIARRTPRPTTPAIAPAAIISGKISLILDLLCRLGCLTANTSIRRLRVRSRAALRQRLRFLRLVRSSDLHRHRQRGRAHLGLRDALCRGRVHQSGRGGQAGRRVGARRDALLGAFRRADPPGRQYCGRRSRCPRSPNTPTGPHATRAPDSSPSPAMDRPVRTNPWVNISSTPRAKT